MSSRWNPRAGTREAALVRMALALALAPPALVLGAVLTAAPSLAGIVPLVAALGLLWILLLDIAALVRGRIKQANASPPRPRFWWFAAAAAGSPIAYELWARASGIQPY